MQRGIVRLIGRPEPDRDVDIVDREVQHPQGRSEAQFDLGVRPGEVEQARGQPFGGEGRACRDGQDAIVEDAFRRPPSRRQRLKPFGRLWGQRRSGIGQFDAPVQTAKQRRTQMFLQRLDLERQGGGRNIQFACGRLKRQMAGGSLKGTQCGERGETIGHDR